jgi:hypothetical protein
MLTVSWPALVTRESSAQESLRVSQVRRRVNVEWTGVPAGTAADRLMRAWPNTQDPQPGWMQDNAQEFVRKFSDPKPEEVADPDA